ncbi:unnamed protein product [Prorocentrum cordatum]|nr:unnamed protein product [Polarella glacialis]
MVVGVPMMGGLSAGGGPGGLPQAAQALAGSCYAAPAGGSGGGDGDVGLEYAKECIVMAAGQYREVHPTLSPALRSAVGGCFRCSPADLPGGLQLDAASGVIWGTPQRAAVGAAAVTYRDCTVVFSCSAGAVSARVGIKVVDFRPEDFQIAHVSQMEQNKYMVLLDTRRHQ